MKKFMTVSLVFAMLLSMTACEKTEEKPIAETTSVISEETTVPEKTVIRYRYPECITFEYDENGKVIENEISEGFCFEYEYDSDKNKIKEYCNRENGDFVYEMDYGLIDGEWRVIHNRYYDSAVYNNIVDDTYDYSREGYFYVVTQRDFNSDGEVIAEFFYNEDKFLVKSEFYLLGEMYHVIETDPVTKHSTEREFFGGKLRHIKKFDENHILLDEQDFYSDEPTFSPDDRTVSTEKKCNSNGTFRIYEYDDNGLLIKENYFDKDGNFTFYDLYKYNDKGQLIKDSFYHATDFLIAYETYLYNEKYQLIEKESYIYGETGPVDSEIMTYDENGNLIRKDIYEKRELSYYLTYSYDKDYVLSGMERYTKDGVLEEKYAVELDVYGRVERVYVYSPDGFMKYYGTFVYEEGGNIIETHYSPDGAILKEIRPGETIDYEYDKDNLLAGKKKINNNGETEYTFKYYHDDKGRISSRHRFDKNGKRTAYAIYEYDTEGFARIESSYALSSGNAELAFKSYYDENDCLLKQEKYASYYGIVVISLYEYDPETQKSSLTEYDVFTGEKTKYTEYDENGEIIKEEVF